MGNRPPFYIATIQVVRQPWATNFLDVSVKSGNRAFAPTWSMVTGYKNKTLPKETYAHIYEEMMLRSQLNNNEEWFKVLQMGEVTFGCYCPPNEFCHRILLVNIFKRYAAGLGYDVCWRGEITKPRSLKD